MKSVVLFGNCDDCKFYRPERRNGKKLKQGSCLRYPPTAVPVPELRTGGIQTGAPSVRVAIKAAIVSVREDGGCGEWQDNGQGELPMEESFELGDV